MSSRLIIKLKKKNLERLRKHFKNSENNSKKTKLRLLRAKTNLTGLWNLRRNEFSPEVTLEKIRSRAPGRNLNKTSEMKIFKTRMNLKKMTQENKSKTKTTMTVIFERDEHMIFSTM